MAVTIRANDVKASNLQFLSLALSAVSFLIYPLPFKPTHYLSQRAFNISQLVGLLLIIGTIWAVRAGKRWAKIVLLLLFLSGVILYLGRPPKLLAFPFSQTLLALLSTILQAASIAIITRDLLRRPVAAAAEAEVAAGPAN